MTSLQRDTNGILETGIVLVLFPSQSLAGAAIERAPDVGGTYGTFTEIGTLDDVDMGGSAFIDILPWDSSPLWYRVRHREPGFTDGPYTVPFAATPKPIPRVNWDSKPWLAANIIPLQLVMDVVTDSSASLHVTASVNRDPAGLGTPTVSLVSYNGLPSAPTPSGTAGWVIQKPSSGFGRAIFQNTLQGRSPDTDAIDVQASSALSASQFLALNLTTSASSAEWVGVSASVYNPSGIATNVSIIASQSIGTITLNGTNRWTINRPSSGEGSVTFLVTGSSGVISDTDTFYVSKDPLPYLTVKATVGAISNTAMTASVTAYDSNNTTATLSGVTMTPSFTSLTGLNATLTNTTSNIGNTVYTFYITRPNYGQGTGRVTFAATKTGFTQDSDSIEVPERVDNLARLRTIATITSMTGAQLVASVSCYDPLSLVSPTISSSISPGGSVSVTGTNPYTITRPTEGSARVTFTGTAAGRIDDSDAVDVNSTTTGSGGGGTTPAFVTDIYRTNYNVSDDWIDIGFDVDNAPSPATYSIKLEADGNLISGTKTVYSTAFRNERTGSQGHTIDLATDTFGTLTQISYQIKVRNNANTIVGSSTWIDVPVWKV